MNILLVDDHALFRAGMRMLLESMYHGSTIRESDTVVQALAIATEHPDIDVCLLDLALQNENGLDGLELIKNAAPQLAIVIVSATEDPATIRVCLDRGAMSFIPKRLGSQALTQVLRHVLAGNVYLPEQIVAATDRAAAVPTLTRRELDVLRCLCLAYSNKLIARELNLSENTVKEYIATVFRVLGVHNRTEAVIRASQLKRPDELP